MSKFFHILAFFVLISTPIWAQNLESFPPISSPEGVGKRTALVVLQQNYRSLEPPAAQLKLSTSTLIRTLRQSGFTVIRVEDVIAQDWARLLAVFQNTATGSEIALAYVAGYATPPAWSETGWLSTQALPDAPRPTEVLNISPLINALSKATTGLLLGEQWALPNQDLSTSRVIDALPANIMGMWSSDLNENPIADTEGSVFVQTFQRVAVLPEKNLSVLFGSLVEQMSDRTDRQHPQRFGASIGLNQYFIPPPPPCVPPQQIRILAPEMAIQGDSLFYQAIADGNRLRYTWTVNDAPAASSAQWKWAAMQPGVFKIAVKATNVCGEQHASVEQKVRTVDEIRTMAQFALNTDQNLDEAIRLMRLVANKDDAAGQWELAQWLSRSINRSPVQEAREWAIKSAQKEYLPAMIGLAGWYNEGRVVAKNLPEALNWYKKAANLGDLSAIQETAQRYAQGIGTRVDENAARPYFQTLASKDDLKALVWLLEKSATFRPAMPPAERMTWLRKAANLGHAPSCVEVAKNLLTQPTTSTEEALLYLQKAAQQNEGEAFWLLGTLYENGKGSILPNSAEAFKWFLKAANDQFPQAMWKVAEAYRNGTGVPASPSEATRWYGHAASNGIKEAYWPYAQRLLAGDGLQPDPEKALPWLQKAAEIPLTDAQYELGVYYLRRPERNNLREGLNWLEKAATAGHPKAAYELGLFLIQETPFRDLEKARRFLQIAVHLNVPRSRIAMQQLDETERMERLIRTTLEDMTSAFDHARDDDRDAQLSFIQKRDMWEDFLHRWNDDIPNVRQDNEMRQTAEERISFWIHEQQDAEAYAAERRAAEQKRNLLWQAYDAVKQVDQDGKASTAQKATAWQGFLHQFGTYLAQGTASELDIRTYAETRLAYWQQNSLPNRNPVIKFEDDTCTASDKPQITQLQVPFIFYLGQAQTLGFTYAGTNIEVRWNVGDWTSSAINPSLQFSELGVFSGELTLSNTCGTASQRFEITVKEAPKPETFANSMGMQFVRIPKGSFKMGSPASDAQASTTEKPQKTVTIPSDFYLSQYEVTQAEWLKLMPANPSTVQGDQLPVDNVTWEDARRFIEKLNQQEGGNHYRLPTEAEWEYAARATSVTRYPWGNLAGTNQANCQNCLGKKKSTQTKPVGRFKPNKWKLYDMIGNVAEWTSDCYNAATTSTTTACSYHVIRGGAWFSTAKQARSAAKSSDHPSFRLTQWPGLRLVYSE